MIKRRQPKYSAELTKIQISVYKSEFSWRKADVQLFLEEDPYEVRARVFSQFWPDLHEFLRGSGCEVESDALKYNVLKIPPTFKHSHT